MFLAWVAQVQSAPATAALSCKDDGGSSVDSYTMLKTPNDADYFYADASSPELKMSSKKVSYKTTGALANTLSQIYGKSSVAYAMYNDEHPDGKKVGSPRAHAKGVLAFNSAGGFWLVHSVPGFPIEGSKKYSGCCSNGLTYGQSFMCLTLDHAELNKVVKQYKINWPSIYDSADLSSSKADVPDFSDWVGGGRDKATPSSSVDIKTRAGVSFTVFAKSAAWANDLYENLVSPSLQSGLVVQTWQNGGGNNGAYCKGKACSVCPGGKYGWDVVDALAQKRGSVSWEIHQDHSKWAISSSSSDGHVCVGDINRQTSQRKRGGGTTCQKNPALWASFHGGISQEGSCSGLARNASALARVVPLADAVEDVSEDVA